jgi:osmotically-inducible protein OsmY
VSVEDKLTNVAVRRILTSCWVDITQVQVRTTGGVVCLTGTLKRMTASHQELSESVSREIDTRIRKLGGVRDAKYQLDNWERKLTAHWVVKIN